MANYKNEKLTDSKNLKKPRTSLELVFEDEIIETTPVSEKKLLSFDTIGVWSGDKSVPQEVRYLTPMPSRGNPLLIEKRFVTMSYVNKNIELMKAEYVGG